MVAVSRMVSRKVFQNDRPAFHRHHGGPCALFWKRVVFQKADSPAPSWQVDCLSMECKRIESQRD
jgi:hypothetical protein